MKLDGKVAIITGGGRGIGRAIALSFARAGAKTTLAARTESELNQVRQEVEGLGGEALVVVTDVKDSKQAERMVDRTLEHFGTVDILVNNAGYIHVARVTEHGIAEWCETIATNLDGMFYCSLPVLRPMIDKGSGRIINLSSVAGVTGWPNTLAYSASKHGVIGFTKTLALEVAGYGITVNAICPGVTRTGMSKMAITERARLENETYEERLQKVLQAIPQHKLAEPEDIAAMALYLASEEASRLTGQAIGVDCGMAPR